MARRKVSLMDKRRSSICVGAVGRNYLHLPPKITEANKAALDKLIGVITNGKPTESELVPRFIIRIGDNGRFEKTGPIHDRLTPLPVMIRWRFNKISFFRLDPLPSYLCQPNGSWFIFQRGLRRHFQAYVQRKKTSFGFIYFLSLL